MLTARNLRGQHRPGVFSGNELNWLNNEIHLLDHRKGEAETVLARRLKEACGAKDRAAVSLCRPFNGLEVFLGPDPGARASLRSPLANLFRACGAGLAAIWPIIGLDVQLHFELESTIRNANKFSLYDTSTRCRYLTFHHGKCYFSFIDEQHHLVMGRFFRLYPVNAESGPRTP